MSQSTANARSEAGLATSHPRARIEVLLVFAACMLALAAIYHTRLRAYYPLSDEFALLEASRKFDLRGWVLSGFSKYFVVYPEWTVPYTDFIRPVPNLLYYIHERLFGDRFWVQLVTVNWACHAGVTALVYWTARSHFGRSRLESLGLCALAFMGAPFFSSPMPYLVSFSFDGIAGLLCLAAVICYARRFVVAATMLLVLAAFTKESALPVTAALVATALCWRKPLHALLLATPIVLFVAIRLWAFGATAGAYPLESMGLRRLFGITGLPSGYGRINASLATMWHSPSQFPLLLATVFAFSCNLAFFVAVARRGRGLVRGMLRPLDGTEGRLGAAAAAASMASFAYVLVIGGDARFAYAGWGLMCIAMSSRILDPTPWREIVAMLASCTASVVLVTQAWNPTKEVAPDGEQLVHAVREATASGAKRVLVVNDLAMGYTSPDLFARFAGVSTPIEPINGVFPYGCSRAELQGIEAACERTGGRVTRIVARIPPCATFFFPGAKLLDRIGARNDVRRGSLRYVFPGMSDSWMRDRDKPRRADGWGGIPELGLLLEVTFDEAVEGTCLIPSVLPGGRLVFHLE